MLLALVFTVAAVGKLADQPGTRVALERFGLPHRLAAVFAPMLPVAELLTAAALLVQAWARWGAASALALLTVFVAGIAHALLRGRAPDCHCFGQLHSAPAGRGTLIRNVVLAGPAVFVIANGPGTRLASWLPSSTAVGVIAVITAAGLAALGAQLYLQNRTLRRDLERIRSATQHFPAGPPIGTPAPRFSLPDVAGDLVTLESLVAKGRPIAMVFVSPECGPCELLFGPLSRWQRQLADRITIVIASRGSTRDAHTLSETYGLRHLLADEDSELFALYRTSTTPSAVILTAEGHVATALHSTGPIVEALIRRALGGISEPAVPRNVAPAPDDGDLRVARWVAPAGK